jgi:hypothetical protein
VNKIIAYMWSKRNGACIHFAICTDAADIYFSLSNKIWALCLKLLYTLRAISCVNKGIDLFSLPECTCFAIDSNTILHKTTTVGVNQQQFTPTQKLQFVGIIYEIDFSPSALKIFCRDLQLILTMW